ncbi:unnamed protein product [Schistosoma turkestanicum]|nr:unnamed protein product [Schistosoma turkestanicum]
MLPPFLDSMNSPIVGSAPVRSNPLGSFPRINSPVSNANFSTRPTGGSGTVVESPLRLIRARCTSLTVSTTGGNSSSNDVNMSSVRIHAPEYQQHQTNKMRNQRIFQPNQSQLRISQPNNQSHLCSSQFQSKPIPQSPHPSSSLSPQHQLTVQHQIQPSSRSGMTFGSIPNQQYINTHNISASLPVNVNPLLCGIQDSDNNDLNDDKIAQLYSFDSSTSPFIPHLKSEPICETDSNHNSSIHSLSLDLCHGNTMNTILEPVTHFDPLIASVMQSSSQHYQQQQQQQQQHQLQHQPYQDQPPLSHHHQHHHQHQHPQHYPHDQYNSQHQLHKQSQQPQQQQHQQQQHQHQQCSFINHTGKSSTKTLDLSTPPILGLDIDEFQFDDVPME